jgi:hypothetical protein
MGWTLTLLSGAVLWLLRDATYRRINGQAAPPYYRHLLWAAVAISGLFAIGAATLAVLGVHDKNGYGPLLTIIFGPLVFGAAACSWALSWYARYPFPDRSGDQRRAGSAAAPVSGPTAR